MSVSTFLQSETGRQFRFTLLVGGLMVMTLWLCLRLTGAPVPAAATSKTAPPAPLAKPVVHSSPAAPPAAVSPRPIPPGQPAAAPSLNRFPKTAFHQAFCTALQHRGIDPESVCNPTNPAELRILAEYGAIFVATETVAVPPSCRFADEAAVTQFQARAQAKSATLNRTIVTLQPAALEAFLAAGAEAKRAGLTLSLHGGATASRRSLADTEEVWNRYLEEALRNWQKKGKLSRDDVTRLRALPRLEQADAVLQLEAKGLYFGLAQHKSILSSAAIPGASQHLSLLALDISEYASPEIRQILARHGWYQTVLDDFPHFTWLGVPEEKLPGLGLHPVTSSRQTFWLPEVKK
jgi:hypothetical protein